MQRMAVHTALQSSLPQHIACCLPQSQPKAPKQQQR
jgi:hypothetical protein